MFLKPTNKLTPASNREMTRGKVLQRPEKIINKEICHIRNNKLLLLLLLSVVVCPHTLAG